MNEPIAIWNAIVIALTCWVSWLGFQRPDVHERLIFEPVRILRDGEYHRIASSALLHGDGMHLLFNMFSLYSFGSHIEFYLGPATFLVIYLSGVIGGSLLSLYLHRHHEYRALGASGGVCGVIFASIFLLPGGSIHMLFIPIGIPPPVYAILFLVFSFVAMQRGGDNIGHDAHIGGALVGLLVTTLMYPYIIRASPGLYSAVCLITLGLFYYCYRFPPHLQKATPFTREHWEQIRDDLIQVEEEEEESNEAIMDRLLDKVAAGGMGSLSAKERQQLQSLSRKLSGKDD